MRNSRVLKVWERRQRRWTTLSKVMGSMRATWTSCPHKHRTSGQKRNDTTETAGMSCRSSCYAEAVTTGSAAAATRAEMSLRTRQRKRGSQAEEQLHAYWSTCHCLILASTRANMRAVVGYRILEPSLRMPIGGLDGSW